jgi:hypothetical protein
MRTATKSRSAHGRDEDGQRRADRDDDRDCPRPFGPLDDDAVEESRVVQGRASRRDRGHSEERAHWAV